MRTLPLGKDGPQVPVVCFGTFPLGGGFGAIPESQATATVHAALDAGLTFIDTAEGYANAEELLGKALVGRRREVFMATKLSRPDHSPGQIDEALERSLRNLQTDCVDLYQVHSPWPAYPIEDTLDRFARHRDAGKIRYFGVSNFTAAQIEEKRIIYVVGRGHSGSTLLDALLGNAPGCTGIGELLSAAARPLSVCSCGQPLMECAFWGQVFAEMKSASGVSWEEAARRLSDQGQLKSFPRTLLAGAGSAWVRDLTRVMEALHDAIRRVSGRPVVVDSSKETTRGLFLARFVDGSHLVFLVRNPLDVVASDLYHFRDNRKFQFLRRQITLERFDFLFVLLAISRWLLGNLQVEVARLRASRRWMPLRFEDFVDEPVEALKRIQAATGVGLEPVIEGVGRGEAFHKHHQLAGNPEIRDQGSVVTGARSRRRPLGRGYTFLVRLLCWPLLLRYGYPVFGDR